MSTPPEGTRVALCYDPRMRGLSRRARAVRSYRDRTAFGLAVAAVLAALFAGAATAAADTGLAADDGTPNGPRPLTAPWPPSSREIQSAVRSYVDQMSATMPVER